METKKQTIRIMAAVLVFVAFVCITDSAKAVITDVNILPEVPAVEDIITIVVSGIEGSLPVSIDDSIFQIVGTSLELDLFVTTGPFYAITTWSHSEIIGALPANSYNLTVREHERFMADPYFLTDTYPTSFTVIPEPTSILLLSMGVLWIRVAKRKTSRQHNG